MKRGRPATPLRERLMDKVAIDDSTKCWHFTGAKNNIGYGMIRVSTERGMGSAHKAMYEDHNDCVVPDNHVVMHLCENYDCVNPDHLKEASRIDVTNLMRSRNKFNCFDHKNALTRKRPRTFCMNCSESISNTHYGRYHGDNCKLKPKA